VHRWHCGAGDGIRMGWTKLHGFRNEVFLQFLPPLLDQLSALRVFLEFEALVSPFFLVSLCCSILLFLKFLQIFLRREALGAFLVSTPHSGG
jgi:hypothetical protein